MQETSGSLSRYADLSRLLVRYGRSDLVTGSGLGELDVTEPPAASGDPATAEALAADLYDANAMVVATVGADFAPSSRMVLLKGVSSRGFVFYTNTGSRKGRELAGNPRCALLFPWHPLEHVHLVARRVRPRVPDTGHYRAARRAQPPERRSDTEPG